jgi:hypothetical protein
MDQLETNSSVSSNMHTKTTTGKLTQIKLQLCNKKNVESELLTIVE